MLNEVILGLQRLAITEDQLIHEDQDSLVKVISCEVQIAKPKRLPRIRHARNPRSLHCTKPKAADRVDEAQPSRSHVMEQIPQTPSQ